jgi:hypothetical protein
MTRPWDLTEQRHPPMLFDEGVQEAMKAVEGVVDRLEGIEDGVLVMDMGPHTPARYTMMPVRHVHNQDCARA